MDNNTLVSATKLARTEAYVHNTFDCLLERADWGTRPGYGLRRRRSSTVYWIQYAAEDRQMIHALADGNCSTIVAPKCKFRLYGPLENCCSIIELAKKNKQLKHTVSALETTLPRILKRHFHFSQVSSAIKHKKFPS